MKKKILSLLVLLVAAVSGAWADETPKVVFEEHFVSRPNNPITVGFYQFINFEEGDDQEVNTEDGELTIFNSDGTLDINNWNRRAINFLNLPLVEGKTYRLEFKLKGSTRFEDGINDGDDRPFCKASAQLLQGTERHNISLLDSDGKEQRGEFKDFDENNYKSYSMTFVFASEQQQKDTYALNNQGELAEKFYLSISIFNPGLFYLKDVVLYEIPSAAPAGDYLFSVAPCEHGSGTVKFFVDEKEVKGANEGDKVNVTVTPDEGYVVGSVTANAYTTWAGARRTAPAIPMLGNVTLTPVEGKANTWTFTMPAANVELKVGYLVTSNLYLSKEALGDKANIAVTAGKTTVAFDDAGKSTTTVIEGSTVTTKYNGTKKILGMKVAKKSAAPKLLNFSPMGQIFYYYEGETWGEAIRNHPENAANGWSIVEFGITVTYNGRALCDNAHEDDITKDTVVNPNGGYMWGPEP